MAAMNPFQIFGLKPQFKIDEQALEEKYLDLQRKVHPDRFASASEAEKRVAQQWATLINDSYAKLIDPVERGKLLCELMGKSVDSERSGSLDEIFLFDQLERREAISDAKSAGDVQTLALLKKEIHQEKTELLSELEKALDQSADAGVAEEIIKKLMFLNRQLQDFE